MGASVAFEGGTDKGAFEAYAVLALLLTGPRPHRGGVLQDKGAVEEGGFPHEGGAPGGGSLRSVGGGRQPGRCTGWFAHSGYEPLDRRL